MQMHCFHAMSVCIKNWRRIVGVTPNCCFSSRWWWSADSVFSCVLISYLAVSSWSTYSVG